MKTKAHKRNHGRTLTRRERRAIVRKYSIPLGRYATFQIIDDPYDPCEANLALTHAAKRMAIEAWWETYPAAREGIAKEVQIPLDALQGHGWPK